MELEPRRASAAEVCGVLELEPVQAHRAPCWRVVLEHGGRT